MKIMFIEGKSCVCKKDKDRQLNYDSGTEIEI